MGSFFHDTESIVEVTTSLHFASNHYTNSIHETGSISQERIGDLDNNSGDQPNNDIDIIDK